MIKSPTYIGFNTVGKLSPPFSLTDIELVKQDLQNAFHTKKGERVMLPQYGSNIPFLLMDPFDDITENAIIEDAISVIETDPRVVLVEINAVNSEHTMQLQIQLLFNPGKTASTLFVSFERQGQEEF